MNFAIGILAWAIVLSACSSSHSQIKSGAKPSGSLSTTTPEAQQALTILSNNCGACHASAGGSGGLGNILDPVSLVQGGWVLPGNASGSILYQSVSARRMPPTGPLSTADTNALAAWINQGVSVNSEDETR